jgi:hypothetical protein
MYEEDLIEIVDPWYILCFSVKWAHEKKVRTYTLADFPEFKRDKGDDSGLCKKLHSVFDEADFLIGHNSIKFDERKARARFAYWNLPPPAPSKSIDTLRIARSQFGFTSNRLNDLGVFLGCGEKRETGGFKLWRAAKNGEIPAFKKMGLYCSRDVELLVQVYEKLSPYAHNHPNTAAFGKRPACPVCQSENVQRRGVRVAVKQKLERWQCQSCAHWYSGKKVA